VTPSPISYVYHNYTCKCKAKCFLLVWHKQVQFKDGNLRKVISV
jgi:hypothetical protein